MDAPTPIFLTRAERRDLRHATTPVEVEPLPGSVLRVSGLAGRPLICSLEHLAEALVESSGGRLYGWHIRAASLEEGVLQEGLDNGLRWIATPPAHVSVPADKRWLGSFRQPIDQAQVARGRSREEVERHHDQLAMRDLLHRLVELEIEHRPEPLPEA